MGTFAAIMHSRLAIARNFLRQADALRLAAFIFVVGCFLGGSFYLFFSVFRYLSAIELIGNAIMERTLDMAFFVFLMMLLFSNIITSFSTFYNSRELDFLFSLPVSPTVIYLTKLLENALYASLATMVLGLPLIVAYGICTHAVFIYYPFALAGINIYIILPAAAASIIIFLILMIFPHLNPKNVIALSIVFIIVQTLVYLKITNPELLKVFETQSEKDLLLFASNLATVGGSYVPSTWFTNVLTALKSGDKTGYFYFTLLLFVCASVVIVAYTVARLTYHQSWLAIGEHQVKKNLTRSLLSRYRPNRTFAFLFKDILVFTREPTQWVQLFIFIVLLVIYVFSLSRTPLYFNLPFWRTVVSFANFAYITFVLATLGVRFIFPSISLERRGIWLLVSSPFSLKKILLIKYLFYLVIATAIIEALLILSNIFIKTDPGLYLVMPVAELLVAAALVSINLGLGGRFPQFNEDNPSRIAAGTGGIIAALVSVAYVGISIVLLATPAYNYLAGRFFQRPANMPLIFLALCLFAGLTFLAGYLPLRIGTRSLAGRDF